MGDDLTGTTLGPFRIERPLGKGAMGAVYVGIHQSKGSRVAIKVVLPGETKDRSEKLAARFEREIKLLSQFRHPNIVRFYGASEDRGIRFYAMELVDGKSLDDLLDAQGSLSTKEAIPIVVQICEALQELHSTGIVHRDLKPGNILVAKDGNVKLTDFGIARDTSAFNEERLTKADHTVGTIAYMSPEQLSGQELTRKSDLYSLGLLFYRMLTGRLPFQAETMVEYVQQRQKGIYPPASSLDRTIPGEIDHLLRDLLAQDPADRPKDAYVVMQRLMEISQKPAPTKTKARPATAVLETVDMKKSGFSTLLATVFGSRNERTARKKGNRSAENTSSTSSILESPWVLGGALLATIGFVIYMFLPLSDQEKYNAAAEIFFEPEVTIDRMEQADREFLGPILENDPNSPLVPAITKLRERLAVAKTRGRMNLAKLTGVLDAQATEAERQYVAALRLAAQGDRVNAQARYESIVRLFAQDPSEKPVVALAEEQLAQGIKFASDDERIQAKRRPVKEALETVRSLRKEGKLKEALDQFASVEQLYGADRDVVDLIEEAGVEFLSVEDLFTRGEKLMASDHPDDWDRAITTFFTAVQKRSPTAEMTLAIGRAKDRLAVHRAGELADKDQKVGLPFDADPIRLRFGAARYVKEQLGDDLNSVDVWQSLAGQESASDSSRGWILLAKAQLDKARPVADEETRRAEKKVLAEQAWDKLIARTDADSKGWRRAVETIYQEDEVTAPVVGATSSPSDATQTPVEKVDGRQ